MRATSAYAQRLAQQFRFSPVGRVTPCAPLAFNVRRAEDCTPYGYAFADLKAPGYAPYVALPVRKKLPHTIPQWVAESSWFFITINCVPPGKNQLCRPDSGDAILTAVKFNHERLSWYCRLCLLMPDHLHAIIAFPREPGMQATVKNWKKFVARKYGMEWQRDFFDHRLRNHHQTDQKTGYILLNPVRKGLCERVEDWRWVYRPTDQSRPSW